MLHGVPEIITPSPYYGRWLILDAREKNEIQVTKTGHSGLDWAKVDPNPTRYVNLKIKSFPPIHCVFMAQPHLSILSENKMNCFIVSIIFYSI